MEELHEEDVLEYVDPSEFEDYDEVDSETVEDEIVEDPEETE